LALPYRQGEASTFKGRAALNVKKSNLTTENNAELVFNLIFCTKFADVRLHFIF
jgi:hypothetical protein